MAGIMKQKRPTEDAVHYRLYPALPEYLKQEDVQKYLQDQLESYLIALSDQLVGYIWQHESFHLGIIPENGTVVYNSTANMSHI